MIRITTTITCDYDITGNDEYKILKYMDENSLSLKEAIEQLQGKGIIDLLYKEPYNDTIVGINKAEFEENEIDEE